MRFFLALEIPPESRSELQTIQKKLQQILPEIRLTEAEKFHLTLAFIGDKPDNLQDDLAQVLEKAAEGIEPFEIIPAFIDGFPNIHYPNVIWVGIKGDIDKLHILRERIKDGLYDLNLETDERRFVPHIAIAKTTSTEVTEEQERKLENLLEQDLKPIKVSSIKLFESIPNHGFHKHNTLFEMKLGKQ